MAKPKSKPEKVKTIEATLTCVMLLSEESLKDNPKVYKTRVTREIKKSLAKRVQEMTFEDCQIRERIW